MNENNEQENYYEDRREFLRVDHETHIDYREVKTDKLSNSKTEVFTKNISACGLLFRTNIVPPALSTILWLKMDQKMMNICSEIESDLVIRDGGIYGRVVRIAEGEPGVSYDVGVAFLRRKNMTEEEIADLPDPEK